MGRLLLTVAYLQRRNGQRKIESASIRDNLPERDMKAYSAVLHNAQAQGFIKKNGARLDGPGFYYCLTQVGEQKCRVIGNWPFASVGLQPPFEKGHAHAVGAD